MKGQFATLFFKRFTINLSKSHSISVLRIDTFNSKHSQKCALGTLTIGALFDLTSFFWNGRLIRSTMPLAVNRPGEKFNDSCDVDDATDGLGGSSRLSARGTF